LQLLADTDHGYGNGLNVKRTVEGPESTGVAGLTIEDALCPSEQRRSGTPCAPARRRLQLRASLRPN
jgi:carboxyvinyl-carboxyphosphonate phosphorylmutase